MSEEARLRHYSKTPDKQAGDHAGHIFGDRFGGSAELDNLVSQLSDVNLSEFKKIENSWERALTETPPKNVFADVKINYVDDLLRPDSFTVRWKIGNGRWQTQLIKNN